jgi:hypothetical protein
MRLPQPFLVVLALAAPLPAAAAPQTGYARAMAPYVAQLDRQCPGRRLQDLTAGDLELVMEGFEDRLAHRQRREIGRAVDHACAGTLAGLGCANTTTLRSFARMGLLPGFATAVCASGWRCAAPGACVETRR